MRRRSPESGFTFIEVIISLMLLAAAASILIGMEGAAVRRTVRDRNAQQAMLAARRVFAAIETNGAKGEVPEQADVPLRDLLQTIGAPESTDENELRVLEQLRGSITVQEWTIPAPKIEENPMRRIDLRIAWGLEPEDSLVVACFVPAPEEG